MSTTEKQYFSLLQSALWDSPIEVEGPIDWEAVMRIAEHHSNNVLLSDVALRLDDSDRPSPQLAARMQKEMRGNLFNQMKLKQILLSAVKLLREHDIEPVLLKGFGLALLYPNPNLRQFGDIDLYVGQDQFHKACKLLRTLPGCYNWGEPHDIGRHYNIEFGPYPMEVHRVSADIEDPEEVAFYYTIEQDGLVDHRQTVDFEGYPLPVPSKEFTIFFNFYHVWEHFLTTGVGWRQVADVAMTLHNYYQSFDIEKLRTWLTAMRLMEPWQTFGWLMVNRLGLPEAELPFYDPECQKRALKLHDRVMAEGNFCRPNHFKNRKPKGRITKKLHSLIGIFVDYQLLAEVFPVQAKHEMKVSVKTALAKNFQKN